MESLTNTVKNAIYGDSSAVDRTTADQPAHDSIRNTNTNTGRDFNDQTIDSGENTSKFAPHESAAPKRVDVADSKFPSGGRDTASSGLANDYGASSANDFNSSSKFDANKEHAGLDSRTSGLGASSTGLSSTSRAGLGRDSTGLGTPDALPTNATPLDSGNISPGNTSSTGHALNSSGLRGDDHRDRDDYDNTYSRSSEGLRSDNKLTAADGLRSNDDLTSRNDEFSSRNTGPSSGLTSNSGLSSHNDDFSSRKIDPSGGLTSSSGLVSEKDGPAGPTQSMGGAFDSAEKPSGGMGDNLTNENSARNDPISSSNEPTGMAGQAKTNPATSTYDSAPQSVSGIPGGPGTAVEPSVGADPASGSQNFQKHQAADRPMDEPEEVTELTRRKSMVNSHADQENAPKTHEKGEKLPSGPGTGEGTGTQYVKTSGVAAEGGDFDVTKPGAGREAE